MRPVKYNDDVFKTIIRLDLLGYSDYEIANSLGVHRNTISLWKREHINLKAELKAARDQGAKSSIERGLRLLAQGATDEEHQEKYIKERTFIDEETGESITVPVEIVKKRKVHKPSVQAIEVLARKYDKEYVKDADSSNNTINILEGFTMKDLQDSLKSNPIDHHGNNSLDYTAERQDVEIDKSDYSTKSSDEDNE